VPTGEHTAYCLHCGRYWTTGDAIGHVCPDCEAANHTGLPLLGCGPCGRAERERLERIGRAARIATGEEVPDGLG
jgi:hypothetical protein